MLQKSLFAFQDIHRGCFTDTGNLAGISDATAINGYFNIVFLDTPVARPAMIFEHERLGFTAFILAEVSLIAFAPFDMSTNERAVAVWALYFNKTRHETYMGSAENFSVWKCAYSPHLTHYPIKDKH